MIDVSTAPDSFLADLDVVSEITSVTIASPPVVTFTLTAADGRPIIGLVPFWEDNHRFVRFTCAKLVPGTDGDPDSWVDYVRGSTGTPTYDSGESLVDNGDGSYVFTFATDVTAVDGIPYEPTLTHRVAGQLGEARTVALEEQNLWYDFVPDGSGLTNTRYIAMTASCNECHTKLSIHGRRFEVNYCVTCHNPDLAEGEGNMSFMIHRIHSAGDFAVLDDAVSYAEVTYPQDVTNCRKCHNADDAETPQADNWRTLPNMAACAGCHDNFGPNATNPHSGGTQTSNLNCSTCHPAVTIEEKHLTANPTPNNPFVQPNQKVITYELMDAAVDSMTNEVTINFKIFADGTPIDVTNLPADLKDASSVAFRYPGFLLAWAQPQGLTDAPADYNNLGGSAAQPLSLGLDAFGPIEPTNPIGTLTFNAADGMTTATITDAASQFPMGSLMRAVGLQGYFQQDLNGDGVADASLHALSVVVAVTGDDERRSVVDVAKCAECHEWFEGHGGNRVFGLDTDGNVSDNVCVMCHVPNLSSSGRTLDLAVPEDAQNLKDMIHGIHASEARTRDYEHVRNFRGSNRFYNWSEVTFPSSDGTANCHLCHDGDSYELPLVAGVLETTVRTTSAADGQDVTTGDVSTARGSVPNGTDWVNSPTASSCFYCHTSDSALAHMMQNGAKLSVPDGTVIVNRSDLGVNFESCATCHGPGRIADLELVHGH